MSYSLFLYSEYPVEDTVTVPLLTDYLTELNFLSYTGESQSLLPGRNLMDYITFLGCSPSLKLGDFESTIRLFHFESKTGLGGESIETIRYPDCKHPLENSTKLLTDYSEQNFYKCPVCGSSGKIDTINWRKTAGFSNLFIEISQIFPKEAIPADKLLDSLKTLTGTNWKWFYSRSTPVQGQS